jgi:tRNA-dihydrouridine synthase
MQNLTFTKEESPLIAQLWGSDPLIMKEAVRSIATLGFAGIDINMGCPDRTVMSHGCGAGMIETPDVAKSIIGAVKEGLKSADIDIPVSVKTRIGKKTIITSDWISFLLEQDIDALTVHGRTAAELSKVPAHWDEIGKAVQIRDAMKVKTVMIGNGDVADARDAESKHKTYGVDGIMIGRGVFANMWTFDRSRHPHVGTAKELLDIMERHITLFRDTWGGTKSYALLKKFYKIYVNGFHDATTWRGQFMETNEYPEALELLQKLKASI